MQGTLNWVEGTERGCTARELAEMEEKLVKEVAQTGAMALRWLINYKFPYAPNQSEA